MTPPQLQAQHGMVRCGRCANVFDGFKTLATLEETKVMLAVFSEYMARNQPQVVIGDEHTIHDLKDCSIVAATYLANDEPIGVVGVLGPRRMAYERIIPMVNGIASRITDYFSSTQTSTEGDMTND